jgi:drug/metabolite transporter (DMT)-like permease
MYFYLLSNFFSVLSYILGIFFVEKDFIEGITRRNLISIYLHIDLINIFIFLIFYRYLKSKKLVGSNVLDVFKNKKQFILFGLPIIASVYKAYLLGFIQLSNIVISNLITPFLICLLAFILLKENLKKNYAPTMLLASIGFLIVNYNKMTLSFENIHWLFSYVLLYSTGQIVLRYYCIKRKYLLEAVFAENFIYAVYGIVFLIIQKSFSFNILFNPFVWLISVTCFCHHFFLIKGVRLSKTFSVLEFLSFSKVIFTVILSFIFFDEAPTIEKTIGAIIIAIAILLFNRA